MELLSPAGSPEALTAAVQNGANAVYLGCGDFNARRRAKNFTLEDLAPTVAYCHVRGVKVYLTLNTLLTDKELPAALDVAAEANHCGVDAVLVQDLGLASLLRRRFPELPLHGSTQMTVHSLSGVQFCADLGMERVVLSRELSKEAIAHICAHSPIEIEVFVHGALCMCYSGQCFFSAMVGGRSGNRGLCAQPCRLPYNGGHPLSLKDMSLAGHLRELEEMGVACVKLEGRMKRPEYVAVVTSVYAAALKEHREPTKEELDSLQKAFSRSGFTQGYFNGEKGPAMFGTRNETDAPDEGFYAAARATYQKERPLVDISMTAVIREGEETRLTVRDGQSNEATSLGLPPEKALHRPLTDNEAATQLSKTGGTPYQVSELDVTLEEGLSVPKSALNSLRRSALDELTALRAAPPHRTTVDIPSQNRPSNLTDPPAAFRFAYTLTTIDQLHPSLCTAGKPPIIDLPAAELTAHQALVAQRLADGVTFRVVLPTIIWDREAKEVQEQLQTLAALGIHDALINSWDAAWLAKSEGFHLWGDYGLGATNAETLQALQSLNFSGATISFEQKFSTIKHLPKPLPLEAIVYGHLPLMMLEQFPGGMPCNSLKDRKSVTFPVVSAPGGRAKILNSQVLYLADKPDWKTAGLAAVRFLFVSETPDECAKIVENYKNSVPPDFKSFTRGLYYRDVE